MGCQFMHCWVRSNEVRCNTDDISKLTPIKSFNTPGSLEFPNFENEDRLSGSNLTLIMYLAPPHLDRVLLDS